MRPEAHAPFANRPGEGVGDPRSRGERRRVGGPAQGITADLRRREVLSDAPGGAALAMAFPATGREEKRTDNSHHSAGAAPVRPTAGGAGR
jgi:hypothetical protein